MSVGIHRIFLWLFQELLLEMQKGDSGDYEISYVGDDSDEEGGSRGHSPDDSAANPGSNRNAQVREFKFCRQY